MKITTQKQVNVLFWSTALMLWSCLLIDVLTDDLEIISAITGLVFIGSLCLLYAVHRSEPGQQVFSNLPSLLPQNRFLRWTLLLAGGIATVDWILKIGEFLFTG